MLENDERKNVLLGIFKKDMPKECLNEVFSDFPKCLTLSEYGKVVFSIFVACFACQLANVVYKALEEYYAGRKNDVRKMGRKS